MGVSNGEETIVAVCNQKIKRIKMHKNAVHFSLTSVFGLLAAALALYMASTADAQSTTEAAPARDLQRLSRVITVFEIARSHVQQWESNPAAQALVAEMTNDLVREARLDVSWKARLFLMEEDRAHQDPDEFERTAITKLGDAKDPSKEIWNADRNRVVSAVMAHNSCVNCHDATVGDVMGHVSLEYR